MEFEYFLGVDGCKGGWVAVSSNSLEINNVQVFFIKNLLDLRNIVPSAKEIVIDMPIGLTIDQPHRACDVLGRKYLGSRSSTLFTPPCYEAIKAKNYELANQINKEKTGLGLSKQSWFLKDKILDAHNAIEQGLYLKEGHPECSFAALSGKPLENSKKTSTGIISRLLYLQEIGFNFKSALKNFPPNMEIKIDDFLDAAILCWTATRVASNTNFTFPPKNDNDKNPFNCIIYI